MVNPELSESVEARAKMGKAGIIALGCVAGVSLIAMTVMATYMFVRQSEPQYPPQMPYAGQMAGQYQQYQGQYQQPQFQQPPQFQPQQPQQFQAPQAQPFQQVQAQPAPLPASTNPANPQLQASSKDILKIVSQLEGFTDNSGKTEATANLPPIQIFFDPRCPYCHKLYDNIAGKAPIHWIPISALAPANGGIAPGATIIQAEKDKPGIGGKEAMRAAFDKKLTAITPSDAHKSSLEQNLGSFVLMAKTLPPSVQAGVPFALIPKADGTFETHVGYTEGDETAIMNAYGK
uniref:Protein-disulfide isomerase n=1 Tax=Agrobacterium rosae TaxID=1972867 RepID=A0ABU4W3M4_9HYPH|nr:hypothetical protein [Agrobacterium rosae]MDX8332379.1 hypothetical protein [Agrobacterium rosae]